MTANASSTHASLFSLAGKRALITGSGQGIGLTLARGLAASGAEIVLNDIDSARLAGSVASLRGDGYVVEGCCFDVTKSSEIESALAACNSVERTVDILINNAGIHRRSPLETMPLESW